MATCNQQGENKFVAAIEYGLRRLGRSTLTLKPQQLDAVRHVYNGKDVLMWLPTGFGKSICYELLPFVIDHKRGKCVTGLGSSSVILVISPLVSLMVDQVTSLRMRGVKAGILSGHSSINDELTVRATTINSYSLLFSAPEAIVGVDKWREALLSITDCVVAIAVDEAHCVSKW